MSISRRTVLKGAASAAVASVVGSTHAKAQEGKQMKPLIIGEGQHTYEVIDNWPKLPESKKFGNTHGVAELADGRILIHNASPTGDCVCEFDPEGNFIRSWGSEFSGGAHGMQLRVENGKEFLYFATTTNRSIVKTDTKGEHVFDIVGYPKEALDAKGQPLYQPNEKHTAEQRYAPTNIAFHPTDGSFYVADGYGSNFIHHYDAKGNYIRTWGGTGADAGQMKCPHGIWCDTRDPSNPRIVVADRANVRLQYFTLDGKYLSLVTDELRHPCHFDQRGDELLIPDLLGRVTIFDKNNKLVIHLGDNPDIKKRANNQVPRDHRVAGQFCSPHQAIWDRAGNIYVAEWLFDGRVTKLTKV
jgi:DNA-binding beta-propeller fold protein YncE